jgi:hypothetical protein
MVIALKSKADSGGSIHDAPTSARPPKCWFVVGQGSLQKKNA